MGSVKYIGDILGKLAPQYLNPILKWPGGKSGELDIIRQKMPPVTAIGRYFEPFLGGGAVYLSMPPEVPAFVNDKSKDLMQLYCNVAHQDKDFFLVLEAINQIWHELRQIICLNRLEILELYNCYRSKRLSDKSLSCRIEAFIKLCRNDLTRMFPSEFTYEVTLFFKEMEKCFQSKVKRMRKLESKKGNLGDEDVLDNIEGSFKAALYTYLRYLYNHSAAYKIPSGQHSAIFYFIRENAYASMFRFNKKGHFNIPYGGIDYNRKDLSPKIEKMREERLVKRLQTSTLECMDFFDFLEKYPPQKNDFIFIDPPYDTEFSSYDRNNFGPSDQQRLATYLINSCPANFMLIIKSTEYVLSLYQNKSLYINANLHITRFEKTYMYTIKERNNRDAIHLMITNY